MMTETEKLRLFIAADHGGYELKQALIAAASRLGCEFVDLGTHSSDSVDYPDLVRPLCERVLSEHDETELLGPCGVLICGSGVGVSIAANRIKGIRAVLACSPEIAKLSRQHNASNVLCLGGRFVDATQAEVILCSWRKGVFEQGRHTRRIAKIDSGV